MSNYDMHIAHLRDYDSIGVEELANRTGLKRRRIAQLAAEGKIPGAVRLNGYQFVYFLTPELLDWADWKRRQVIRRKHPTERENRRTDSGIITIQGLRQAFEIWLRRVGRLNGILKMEPEDQQDILIELQAFARLHYDIYRALNPKQH